MVSDISEKNFWNYYAVAPWSSDQEAHDHRLRYWIGAISLGILSLGAYPAILGLVLLGEKIYKSLKGRVQLAPPLDPASDKARVAGKLVKPGNNNTIIGMENDPSLKNTMRIGQCLIERPDADENNVVTDMRYYPYMLSLKEENSIRVQCSFPPKDKPLVTPLEQRQDVDYKGKIAITAPSGGYLGDMRFGLGNDFVRIDGIDWRQFPGDLLVEVVASELQEKGDLGWKNLDNWVFNLPTQLLYGKEEGDIIEFIYKNKRYALEISRDRSLTGDLLNLAKNIKAVENAPNVYPFPYKYLSHIDIKKRQMDEFKMQLLLKNQQDLEKFLENLEDKVFIDLGLPKIDTPSELSTDLSDYVMAKL